MREPMVPAGKGERTLTGWPMTLMVPEVGRVNPRRSFMVVDFPAPLGPRNP
jgi:hypothetical protein